MNLLNALIFLKMMVVDRRWLFSGIFLATLAMITSRLIMMGSAQVRLREKVWKRGYRRQDPCKSPCLLKEPTILEHLLSVSVADALKTMPFVTLRRRKCLRAGKRTSRKKDIRDDQRLIRKAHVGREKGGQWRVLSVCLSFFYLNFEPFISFPALSLIYPDVIRILYK